MSTKLKSYFYIYLAAFISADLSNVLIYIKILVIQKVLQTQRVHAKLTNGRVITFKTLLILVDFFTSADWVDNDLK